MDSDWKGKGEVSMEGGTGREVRGRANRREVWKAFFHR